MDKSQGFPSPSRHGPVEGVVPIIPTPFLPDSEEIDFEGLGSLIAFAVANGFSAVCLPAYGSEYYKLAESERLQVTAAAVELVGDRMRVIAQSNHPSALVAATYARRNVEAGASMVSFELPRLFPLYDSDLLTYASRICEAVDVPVLIQDFNMGGPTIGADFCAALHRQCPNFLYVKLEEPLMGAKVRAIREATDGQVSIFEGWGGLYMLELIDSGISGVMPSLGVSDVLDRVWRLGKEGRIEESLDLFQQVLPQVAFGIGNMELFVLLEKHLLVERNLLRHAVTRSAGMTLSDDLSNYSKRLNRRILTAIEQMSQPT